MGAVDHGCGTHVDEWSLMEEASFTATAERALGFGMNFFDTAEPNNAQAWLG